MKLSFNPCFNGSISETSQTVAAGGTSFPCFNPCFNGSISETPIAKAAVKGTKGCFNPCFNGSISETSRNDPGPNQAKVFQSLF